MHDQGFGNCVESDRLRDIQSTSAPLAWQFNGRPRNSFRLAPAIPGFNPLARGEQNARRGVQSCFGSVANTGSRPLPRDVHGRLSEASKSYCTGNWTMLLCAEFTVT